MKRLLTLAATVFVFTACASAPSHLEGRYALVFGNVRSERGEFLSDLREALADRLTTVEIVPDGEAASGYDAVIVIHPIEYHGGGDNTQTRVAERACSPMSANRWPSRPTAPAIPRPPPPASRSTSCVRASRT